jgi:hypothetical protein
LVRRKRQHPLIHRAWWPSARTVVVNMRPLLAENRCPFKNGFQCEPVRAARVNSFSPRMDTDETRITFSLRVSSLRANFGNCKIRYQYRDLEGD